MDRKYTIIFILIWLIISIIIALFFFLPFIFFAIAVLLILLAYDFYKKGKPHEDKRLPNKAQPEPAVPSPPIHDAGRTRTMDIKPPVVSETLKQEAIDLKNKGNTYFRQNKFEEAIRCYASAVEIDPGYIDAWNNLGLAFLKTGKVDLAKSCNEKVKELKGNLPRYQAAEPVVRSPGIAEKPVPEEPAVIPDKKVPQQEAEPEAEADTISFLRNVARPSDNKKSEPEYKSDTGRISELPVDLREIPIITADKEPDWKDLFKSVSDIESHGATILPGRTKDQKSKEKTEDNSTFDRVTSPVEPSQEPAAYPSSEGKYIPEPSTPDSHHNTMQFTDAKSMIGVPEPEEISTVQDQSDIHIPVDEVAIEIPEPEEIGPIQDQSDIHIPIAEVAIEVPQPEEISPGQDQSDIHIPIAEVVIEVPQPEEIGTVQDQSDIHIPVDEVVIEVPQPEEISPGKDQSDIHIPVDKVVTEVPEPEDISPGQDQSDIHIPVDEVATEVPEPENISTIREEIPVHPTVQSASEPVSPDEEDEELFPFELNAEVPGYTLLPPELEEFTEDITETIIPETDSFHPTPAEQTLESLKEPSVPETNDNAGLDRIKPSDPGQSPVTPVPTRKSDGSANINSETIIRKPKAERFPQEMTGGFEPYEQMVAHESLLTSEKAAREEYHMPGTVTEKQILIVDDNDYIVTGLEHMLKKNGYLTASCNNGQDALEILGKKKIDAVLLDLNMEPMSGWQLLSIIRSDSRTKDIPVIIFSAKETLQEEASRTPLKISAFLAKPVNTRLLLSELKKIFETEKSDSEA